MKLIGSINHYRADSSGWIGSAVMFGFAVLSGYRWHESGLLYWGLLIIRDLTASWFLLTRNPSMESAKKRWSEVLAYVSSAFPFVYLEASDYLSHTGLVSTFLATIGFTVSTLALFDLGASFGVSPTNRGVVRSGLYRYVRHPMYLGYVISEFGFVFINPINAALWCISFAMYFFRMKLENQTLAEKIEMRDSCTV